MDAFETGQNAFKVAAKALLNACAELRYDCTFIGEVACFAYGGSRPPRKIEAVATPTIAREHYPSTGSLKRLIASVPTGVDGTFVISPLDVFPTVLSFRHNKSSGRWQRTLIVDIIFDPDVQYAEMQSLQTINGMQYASPEYVLADRLKLWFEAYTLPTQTNETREITNTHRIREIDPLLRHLVKTGTKVNEWNRFDGGHVFKYCRAYPNSAGLWIEVGFEPKMADTSNLKSDPPVPNPPPVPLPPSLPAPSPVPPPYERQPPAPSPISNSLAGTNEQVSLSPELLTTQLPPVASDPQAEVDLSDIQLVLLAAQRTIDILHSVNLPSAICGTLACFLYGALRPPTDIELLVFPSQNTRPNTNTNTKTNITIEDIQTLLISHNPSHFFLFPPPHIIAKRPNPSPTLRYRLHTLEHTSESPASCKIHLGFPSSLNLSHLHPRVINWDEGLPLLPFPLVLLLKLRSWEYQSKMVEKWEKSDKERRKITSRAREQEEVEDIRSLFELDLMQELRNEPLWMDKTLFSWEFLTETSSVARRFCVRCPEMEEDWRGIKFII